MINSPGQHHRNTQLGEIIYEYCLKSDIKTIVEIGTWNGLGTTKCIRDAIVDSKKDKYLVLSLECNKEFYDIAVFNNGGKEPLPNFKLIHGTIVKESDFLDPMSNFDDKFFASYPTTIPNAHHTREQHREWMLADLNGVKDSEYVMDMMPDSIDLLILDGGGFAGFVEFEKLRDISTYFILDDVESTKNYDVAQYIRNSSDYEILIDVFLDKNHKWACNPQNFYLWQPMNGLMVAKKNKK